MHIKLAYGKTGHTITLDDAWNVQVVEPRYIPGLADAPAALQQALRAPIGSPPLAQMAQAGAKVGIILNDLTRPTPNPLLLHALLAELPHIPKDDITLFIALGTHRPNTPEELRAMLGEEALAYRIVQNNCFDPATQERLGQTKAGHEVWLNADLARCDVKILTGFIEPHFFAGFSGGGKAVMPGMAGLRTILQNHCYAHIASPKATWGVTHGNPVWEEVREVARMAGKTFLLNVALNREKAITAIFAGDLDSAHAAGTAFVRQAAMQPVEAPFDIVVTTNSGYPLDLNLYQTVKGMSAAAQVVKKGGAIVSVSQCWDGIPAHGLFGKLLKDAGSPAKVLETVSQPGFLELDQWEAQVQAQVQLKAEVHLFAEGLTDQQITDSLLIPCRSVEATLKKLVARAGPGCRICVLPEGPQTVPYVKEN